MIKIEQKITKSGMLKMMILLHFITFFIFNECLINDCQYFHS